MILPFLLVLIAVCFSVTGELFLKAGMNQVGTIHLSSLGSDLWRTITNPRVLTGFVSIGVGAVFWLATISRVQLSWAYPMLSLGYILVLLFSALILREHVSAVRWLGAGIGLVHALAVLIAVMPVLPGFHPRMASERRGPEPTRALEPPGFLALHYGHRTPAVTIVAHLVYGAILGGFYHLLGR